jgi:uncharacterized membrane protein
MISTMTASVPVRELQAVKPKQKRLDSIDLLRGVVMIIMALDHVRGYFHKDAFFYNPTDLTKASTALFFTRFITHYCAPIFVFLAGTSAYLSGQKKTKKELSRFLLTRGLWLIFIEIFAINLFRTFNPSFFFINLQVIWVIGVAMMIMSALIYLDLRAILIIGVLLVVTHNLLDAIHVPGNEWVGIAWAVLHDPTRYHVGNYEIYLHYPLIPWLGTMALGYCAGRLYAHDYNPIKRRKLLMTLGVGAILLFVLIRSGNWYGDAAHWSNQNDAVRSMLSFLNVTKYPPSLSYILITMGPGLIFLSLAENMRGSWQKPVITIGRVPMFYYLAHILLIHILALPAALICGYDLNTMILSGPVNENPALKGYGFNLFVTHVIWISLVLMLYPSCKWFARYKAANSARQWWLSYL